MAEATHSLFYGPHRRCLIIRLDIFYSFQFKCHHHRHLSSFFLCVYVTYLHPQHFSSFSHSSFLFDQFARFMRYASAAFIDCFPQFIYCCAPRGTFFVAAFYVIIIDNWGVKRTSFLQFLFYFTSGGFLMQFVAMKNVTIMWSFMHF